MHKERLITVELPGEWKKQMYFIPATDQQFVIKEVLIDECYAFDFKPTDVVLNLGGNIGAFDVAFYDRVKQIITYEPDKYCYDILIRHLKLNKIQNVIAYNTAISYFDGEIPFSNNINKGHNGYDINGEYKVKCEDINRIYEQYKPNKIKCDIEGFEYDIFNNFDIPDYVDEIWLETHTWNEDMKEKHIGLKDRLEADGFTVTEIKNDEEDRTYLLQAKKIMDASK